MNIVDSNSTAVVLIKNQFVPTKDEHLIQQKSEKDGKIETVSHSILEKMEINKTLDTLLGSKPGGITTDYFGSTTNCRIEKVDFSFTQMETNLRSILDLVTASFFKNHEITRDAYERTPQRHKHAFEYLFREYVCDTLEEIQRGLGSFFIAKSSEKIVAIAIGRAYGLPAVSTKFTKSLALYPPNFQEIIADWCRLTEKFQLTSSDLLPSALYHQTLFAVHPEYTGKGIGTDLSEFIMLTVQQMGFSAVAIEPSSRSADAMIQRLSTRHIVFTPIDSVTNQKTGTRVTFGLEFPASFDITILKQWFLNKGSQGSISQKGKDHVLTQD